MPSTKERLLKRAEIFAERKGIALSTLGRIVMKDGKFFKRLKDGDCTTSALDRFSKVFDDPATWERAKEDDRRASTKAA